jgi:hypothetical protein
MIKSITLLLLFAKAQSRTVNIEVNAPWPSYAISTLVETSEFLFDEAPQNFFKYVDQLCQNTETVDLSVHQPNEDSISELHALSNEIAKKVSSTSLHALMDTMLGVGYYAPTIQFFQSISILFGNPCSNDSFIVEYPTEKVYCLIPDEFAFEKQHEHDIGNNFHFDGNSNNNNFYDNTDFEWEHIYNSNNFLEKNDDKNNIENEIDKIIENSTNNKQNSHNSDLNEIKPHIVLYGIIGSTSFCDSHNLLLKRFFLNEEKSEVETVNNKKNLKKSFKENIKYSIRHAMNSIDLSATSSKSEKNEIKNFNKNFTTLQGYGVFLDIKNMEYKNVDDSELKTAAEKNDGDNIDDENKLVFFLKIIIIIIIIKLN